MGPARNKPTYLPHDLAFGQIQMHLNSPCESLKSVSERTLDFLPTTKPSHIN